MIVCLDSKGQLLQEKKLSDGSVNMSLISPREIFLEALRWKAVNILLVHNHPSGDPNPSEDDFRITYRIEKGAQLLELELADHIIIGDNIYYSFKENGKLI